MLKRKHQAIMLTNSLFLFERWNYEGKKFIETVKKLLRLANTCKINESTESFIYVLVKVVYLQRQKVQGLDEIRAKLEEELKNHIGTS